MANEAMAEMILEARVMAPKAFSKARPPCTTYAKADTVAVAGTLPKRMPRTADRHTAARK